MANILPIILSIEGTILSEQEKNMFYEYNIAGIVIFERNVVNNEEKLQLKALEEIIANNPNQKKAQDNLISLHNIYRNRLKALIEEIKKTSNNPHLIVAIDQEGPRVCRLTAIGGLFIDPDIHLNPSHYKKMVKTCNIESVYNILRANTEKIAKELHDLGINVNFSPSADLLHINTHAIMAERCYADHNDHQTAINLCRVFIEAHQKHGVAATIKHYPGFANSTSDPHTGRAVVTLDKEHLEQNDLKVFFELADQTLLMMVGHNIYTSFYNDDQICIPSSIDPNMYKYAKNNTNAILITDALEMHSLNDYCETKFEYKQVYNNKRKEVERHMMQIPYLSTRALNAGADIVMYCSANYNVIKKTCEYLQQQNKSCTQELISKIKIALNKINNE